MDLIQLANLYQVWGNASETENSDTSNATTQAEYHQGVADALTEAALDLHWDPEKVRSYLNRVIQVSCNIPGMVLRLQHDGSQQDRHFRPARHIRPVAKHHPA